MRYWKDIYQLKDEATVRETSVKDFAAVNISSSLELLVTFPNDAKPEWAERAKDVYQRAQDAYDRREPLFSSFKLNSEYFPIVIIRSLLPRLGHYIENGDYKTAYMISGWINDDIRCWRQLMQDFGHKIGKDPRSLQKPA